MKPLLSIILLTLAITAKAERATPEDYIRGNDIWACKVEIFVVGDSDTRGFIYGESKEAYTRFTAYAPSNLEDDCSTKNMMPVAAIHTKMGVRRSVGATISQGMLIDVKSKFRLLNWDGNQFKDVFGFYTGLQAGANAIVGGKAFVATKVNPLSHVSMVKVSENYGTPELDLSISGFSIKKHERHQEDPLFDFFLRKL